MQGEPTAAQRAQGAKPDEKKADKDCLRPALPRREVILSKREIVAVRCGTRCRAIDVPYLR